MPSVFEYDADGMLAADGMPLDAALAEAGASTPAYIYAARAVTERFDELQSALSAAHSTHLIAVALKANALPALVVPLFERGAGAEAVSAAELLVASGLGLPGERIVMSGVGKTTTDLDTALDLEVRFVSVESEAELHLLNARATQRGMRARAVLRLNPAIAAATHPKIATGTATAKFGIAEAELVELASRHREWPALDIIGVHAHIGSQILDIETLAQSARRLGTLFTRLREVGAPVRIVDVGGGLGIPQQPDEPEVSLAAYADAVVAAACDGLGGLDAELVFEPGRSLFGAAGALVVRVLHTKRTASSTDEAATAREFCVVDGGMNDFLRPAMYGAHHRIAPLRRRAGPERKFDVVGGVCESGDAFARDRLLTPPEAGDLLAILDAGAYGYSMSSNYNLRPRPAEVVIHEGSAFLARPAEDPSQLVARELAAATHPPPVPA